MHALVSGKARMAARTLLARAGSGSFWRGFASGFSAQRYLLTEFKFDNSVTEDTASNSILEAWQSVGWYLKEAIKNVETHGKLKEAIKEVETNGKVNEVPADCLGGEGKCTQPITPG